MGKMWKYEPEDYDNSHLQGPQFYQKPTTIDYETDNDGNAIHSEPTESVNQKIRREKGNAKRSKADL